MWIVGEVVACVWVEDVWELSVLSAHLRCEPENTLKNKVCF